MVTALAPVAGVQEPRVCWVPEHASLEKGRVALQVAESLGIKLDPWQQFALLNSLATTVEEKWAAFEVALMVSRQNGKDEILIVRAAAGLEEFDERLIIHSAHQFDTSLEAFMRLEDVIAGTPEWSSKVARISRSHGEEGLRFKNGNRIRFRTRTKGGGRGFSCDCLMLNEAMVISEMMHGALLPTLSARPNPQVIYAGSAVDEEVHEHGVVFARARERGLANDKGLAYFDWSLDCDLEEAMEDAVATDPENWARSNPGLGIRIAAEHVDLEQRSMDARTFAVERLGVGAWPRTDRQGSDITQEMWKACEVMAAAVRSPVCLAFDVTPDRRKGSIALAGWREDERIQGELLPPQGGIDWMVPEIVRLKRAHNPMAVVCDPTGPAGALLAALVEQEVEVVAVTAREHAQACGMFFDAVDQRIFSHLGAPELANALKGAKKRALGDAWAWSRKNSGIDISPLVSFTLAAWGLRTQQVPGPWVSAA